MSIYTSFSIPGGQSRKPVGKKATPFKGVRPQTPASTGDSVKFGLAGQKRGNGVWVTTECSPYVKNGGLGEVSQTIPNAFSNYTDKDLRIIVPYEKEHQEHDQKNPDNTFRKTNLTLKVKLNQGVPPVEFEVLQKFEPALNGKPGKGNWVYALKKLSNGSAKQKKADQDEESLSKFTYDGPDQKRLENFLLFNRAAGALTPYLNGNGPKIGPPKAGQQELHRFKDQLDFVIGNDWLTGPVLYSPEVQAAPQVRKIFMLHNTYDNIQGSGFIEHIGQPVPADFTKVTDDYSPLTLALKSADGVIANRNYVKTITETPFMKGQKFVEILKEHSKAGRVFDMHHGLAEDFTPKNNQALRENYASWQASLLPALDPIAKAPTPAKRAEIEKNARQNIEKSAPRLDNLSQCLNTVINRRVTDKISIDQSTIASLVLGPNNRPVLGSTLIAMIEAAPTDAAGCLTSQAKTDLANARPVSDIVPNLAQRDAWLDATQKNIQAARAILPMIEKGPTDVNGLLTQETKTKLAADSNVAQLVAAPADRERWLDTITPIIKAAAARKEQVNADTQATLATNFPARNYQFEELQADTPEAWQRFKAINKAALQTKYGLTPDPDAVVVSWAARLDPYQKGFYMVQNTLEDLLKKNPKLQVVIAGPSSEPSVIAWIKRMNENPAYKGRFYMPNKFVDKTAIAQINAGSDFVILPSLYEPYGLTQLEAMKMGSIPIVHGRDGLRTSVSDPLVNGKDFIGRSDTGKDDIKNKDEAAWFDPETGKEWQTGFLMRPMRALHGPEDKDVDNAWGPEPEFTKPWEPGLIKKDAPVRFAVDVPGYQAMLDFEIAMRNLEQHVWNAPGHKSYEPSKPTERQAFMQQSHRMAKLLKDVLKEEKKRVKAKQANEQKPGQDPIFKTKEVKQLEQLYIQLSSLIPRITLEDKDQIFDRIIRPHLVDIVTKPAESSFTDAVQRAVEMNPKTRAEVVRVNAKRYVDSAHTWQSIVERYKDAIDPDVDYKAPPLKFHDPTFKLAKPADKPADDPNLYIPKPKTIFQQIMDWLLFLINPLAWLRALQLRFN